MEVFSSGLCTNILLVNCLGSGIAVQTGNPSVPASSRIANDGLSLSLASSLRCRLNNNFPLMVSFLLAVCALWTCSIASLFHF